MAYDIKYREKVMEYISKGHTIEEAHEVFGVGTATIKGWRKLKRETGVLERRSIERKNRKINSEQLIAYVTEHPDSYLREIAEVFNCTYSAIYYALKRLKITRKKNYTVCGKVR